MTELCLLTYYRGCYRRPLHQPPSSQAHQVVAQRLDVVCRRYCVPDPWPGTTVDASTATSLPARTAEPSPEPVGATPLRWIDLEDGWCTCGVCHVYVYVVPITDPTDPGARVTYRCEPCADGNYASEANHIRTSYLPHRYCTENHFEHRPPSKTVNRECTCTT